jgi:hypothetical protein
MLAEQMTPTPAAAQPPAEQPAQPGTMPDTTPVQKTQDALKIELSEADKLEFVTGAMAEISQATNDTTGWRSERELDYQYEHGLIGKMHPDLPFEGAPDIRYCTSKMYKRAWMGDFISPVLDVQNTVKVSGGGGSKAATMQEFYNNLYKVRVRNFPKIVRSAASRYLGAAGNCIIKVSYDYTTQKSTKADANLFDLKLAIKAIDLQIKSLDINARILGQEPLINNAEQPPMEGQPSPGDTPANSINPGSAQPSSSAQIEALKKTPLLLVAEKYKYNLDNPNDKARAESVLSQLRAGEDVVVAIIERALCPLKLTVMDHWTDLIIPAGTLDIQEAPWLAELMIYDQKQLRDEESSEKFKGVDEMIQSVELVNGLTRTGDTEKAEQNAGVDQNLPMEAQQARDFRNLVQGLTQGINMTNKYPVIEMSCWIRRKVIDRFNGKLDADDDSYVRAIVDFCPNAEPKKAVLRMMEHPNDFEGMFNWNYIQGISNDMGEGVYGGEGIPRLNQPFEKEELESGNAALARDIMAAAPLTIWNGNLLYGDVSTPEERRLPGHNMTVEGNPENVLKIFQMPDLATPLHADVQRNRVRGKEMVGIADTSGLPNYDRPPTTGQINTVTGPANSIKTSEIKNWLVMWGDVYLMAHLVLKQYYFRGVGANESHFTNEMTGEDLKITPEDFAPNYIIKAGADPSVLDNQQLINNGIAWIQLIGINPSLAPYSKPSEWVPDMSSLMLGASRTQKWTPSNPQERQAREQMFIQAQAEAVAAKQANQKKREGASTQVKQLPGQNSGGVGIGIKR